MTPAELGHLHEFIRARHGELATMFGDLQPVALAAEGRALAPAASLQLERARLLEVRDELRRFLVERAGQDSFLMRRSV